MPAWKFRAVQDFDLGDFLVSQPFLGDWNGEHRLAVR